MFLFIFAPSRHVSSSIRNAAKSWRYATNPGRNRKATAKIRAGWSRGKRAGDVLFQVAGGGAASEGVAKIGLHQSLEAVPVQLSFTTCFRRSVRNRRGLSITLRRETEEGRLLASGTDIRESTSQVGMLAVMSDVTRIVSQIESGDDQAAEELLPLVYEELRKLAAAKMAQENPDQTLQATAGP